MRSARISGWNAWPTIRIRLSWPTASSYCPARLSNSPAPAPLPVVLLPHGRDHADNAARVRAHGAGITLPRTASPQRIARAVRHVLKTPGPYRAAATLGAVIRRDTHGDQLLHELEPTSDG